MILTNNKQSMLYKILFDGSDFLTNEVGSMIIPDMLKEYIISLTTSEIYDNVHEFLDYCPSANYIGQLSDKYKVRLYRTSWASDKNNPWNNKQYILFNPKQLQNLDIEFYVCPSFDEDGNVDIGFRVVDVNSVHNAFKWLFMQGNNMIYGRDTVNVNKPCYIVEGFRDYVALKESGYNVIGLGSVYISEKQKQYINTLAEPILLLDNDKFGLQQTLNYSKDYKVATLIHTLEKDAWDTYSKGIPIKIVEIK